MVFIKFLGTCGGRFATIFQTRSTGGIYFSYGETGLVIDPGPGSLVRLYQENIEPTELDGVVVSHSHIDHANDCSILAEAMTKGSTRRNGVLVAPISVTRGNGVSGPIIHPYYTAKLNRVYTSSPGKKFHIGKVNIMVTKAVHSDPSTVGYIFSTDNEDIGYIPDTEYFDGIEEAYRNCRVLIISSTRPLGARIKHHLCTEDVAKLVGHIRPKKVFLTHFGLKTLQHSPEREAEWISEKTGISTIAASDSMSIMIRDKIEVFK